MALRAQRYSGFLIKLLAPSMFVGVRQVPTISIGFAKDTIFPTSMLLRFQADPGMALAPPLVWRLL
ncbi:hypothetical protein ASD50_21730 [Mesorhizobium sp. Root552]|nr:hypothetical protein ASD50_21730 [Mesorhizobium sp. Root552]